MAGQRSAPERSARRERTARPVDRTIGVAALVVALAVAVGVVVWWPWGGEDGSTEELCDLLRDRTQFATVVEGFEPSDVAGSLEQLQAARVELQRLRSAAPAEVHADLDVQLRAVDVIVEALAGVPPGDMGAASDAVRAVEPQLAAVPAAYERLERWTTLNCG